MQGTTGKCNTRDLSTAPFTKHNYRAKRGNRHRALNFLIIIGIVFCSTNTFSGKASNIHGVQIELGSGNRICMSFEGEIRGIIVNGNVNLPGTSFENIARVGNTKISRSHFGRLARIGRVGIHRNWRGSIIKIGDAEVLRDKHGSVIAVNGDPNVSPLFAINSP